MMALGRAGRVRAEERSLHQIPRHEDMRSDPDA
jgi:hypothetical protein